MRYECPRCGAIENTTNEPHLCKDLKKRLERQKQAVNLVIPILQSVVEEYAGSPTDPKYLEYYALEIIKKIGARDNGL